MFSQQGRSRKVWGSESEGRSRSQKSEPYAGRRSRRTEQSRSEQNRAEQNRAEQSRAEQSSPIEGLEQESRGRKAAVGKSGSEGRRPKVGVGGSESEAAGAFGSESEPESHLGEGGVKIGRG
eukprot:gene5877-biopygen10308